MGSLKPILGHSIFVKFIRQNTLYIQVLTFQCANVHFYNGISRSGALIELIFSLKINETLKGILERSLRLYPASETANINLLVVQVLVSISKRVVEDQTVLSDHMIFCLLKVFIITFINIPQKVITVIKDTQAPVQVRYSGYSSYRRN